jgi:hypothetical protein
VVVGQQPRDLTWNEMRDDVGGGGYRVVARAGQWVRVDGIRVDNVEDAFLPRGPDGRWELHNAYMTYIRDDCIENDETAPGSVHDSLLDGCYTGFSEQWQHECCDASPGESFVVDRVLMRLEAMPRPCHGRLFNRHAEAGRGEAHGSDMANVTKIALITRSSECSPACSPRANKRRRSSQAR